MFHIILDKPVPTQNKMTVENYYVHGRRIEAGDIDINKAEERQLLISSMLCNDSSIADGNEIGDPMKQLLSMLARELMCHMRTKEKNLSEPERFLSTATGS